MEKTEEGVLTAVVGATSAPVELRYMCVPLTLDDVNNGAQGVRMHTGLVINGQQQSAMFWPPKLQWRHKERLFIDGKPTFQWSPWLDVPIVTDASPIA